MNKLKDIVDRLLQETIGDGDVSHLSGAGKPLKLKDESLTPTELRAAHKIMGDNEVVPDWIAAGHLLGQLEARLRQQINRRAARHLRDKESAAGAGARAKATDVQNSWGKYKEDYIERVGSYNRDALLYNLKAPQGIMHKKILNGEDLIRRALQSSRTTTGSLT